MFAHQVFRTRRHELGLTLRDVSIATGITEGQLSRIQNGENEPAFTRAVLIARALDLPVEDLFAEEVTCP